MIHSKKLMKIKLLNTSQANFNKRLNDHLSLKLDNYESVEKTVDKILKKIEKHGGVNKILSRGDFGYSPAPGQTPKFD